MKRVKLATCACMAFGVASAHAADFNWDAGSGLLPSQVLPPFTLVNTADTEQPALSSGLLTISDNANGENIFFIASGTEVATPENLTIDFRMRFVSGSSSFPYRTSASIAFSNASGIGNSLFIGQDNMFLLSANASVGPQTTAIDTDGVAHNYRITLTGRSAGSPISVWQDDILLLTGQTFLSVDANGTAPRVLFGEGSTLASGTSEWQYFNTNVTAVPEPSTYILMLAGVLAMLIRQRSRVRQAAA